MLLTTTITASPTTKYGYTNSPEHFEQARKWLTMCREDHKLCNGIGNTQLELPTRLLYVSGGKDWKPGTQPEIIKLVQTNQTKSCLEYLAFSHCWGPPSEMQFRLLARNIDSCCEGIDFSLLSQNMQDAITTTLSLGFSYIWIDSLCIIQRDDAEDADHEVSRKDWVAEAKKMGSVYAGAVCTVASTGSSSSSGGCFHERSRANLEPCKIGVSSSTALSPGWIYARSDDVFDFERNVDLAPLNSRGWVMQERLLSRRVLHFGAGAMYWECGGRSASELNPHGYTYKRYPEDFKDNYSPEMSGYINTRADVARAEREGRGFTWASEEMRRRRPPPVMIDPDAAPGSQAVWRHKRGFWKNILKIDEASWADDDGDMRDGDRAGFRAAFERLRGDKHSVEAAAGEDATQVVGRDSFSQVWYDVVEPYSRGKLTAPADKLIALKGIEDEVARATRFTYLWGVWKERLLTDLLWFAIEGPGRRLLDEHGVPVAPTWSWASIEGAVALDLLPENSRRDIERKETLVTIADVDSETDSPQKATVDINGPLLSISAPAYDGIAWHIEIGQTGYASARVFPDVVTPDICQMAGLACLSFFVLDREKNDIAIRSPREDIQGLVLRLVARGRGNGTVQDVYERVGYFTTSYVARSHDSRKARQTLKNAEVKTLRLTGWSGL